MRICIVGLGLIGGSIAQGLYENHQIHGVDISKDTLDYAMNQKWIVSSSTEINDVIEDEIIILALYPEMVKPWIEKHQQYLLPHAIIVDTSGVKTTIIDEVMPILRDDLHFIGAHPMAGKEKSGIQVADASIFKGANIIIVETDKDKNVLDKIEQLAKELKFGHISCLSKEEHDEMIGFLSQLTHVIAICLMNTNDHPMLQQYSGDSFRDLTRIAAINERLWTPLFLMNKPALLKEIDSFMKEMEVFKEYLLNEDIEHIKKKMISSKEHRLKFDK